MEYKFKVGDKVIFTNDYGVVIRGVKTILSIDADADHARYYIKPTDSPWYSVRERNLSPANEQEVRS